MLTDEEIREIREQSSKDSGDWHFDTLIYARAIERAVLAKAAEQLPVAIKGCGAWDGLGCLDELPDGSSLYLHPLPAQSITEWMPIETMPNNRTSVQVYCDGADCVGIANKTSDGKIVMPEPQAIGYDSLTHWKPLSASPKP